MARIRHPRHHRTDANFGRFAISIIAIAILFSLIAMATMWFLADKEGNIKLSEFSTKVGDSKILMNILPQKVRDVVVNKNTTEKSYLFYTNDDQTLEPILVDLPKISQGTPEKAKMLIEALAEGKGSGFARTAVPSGTKVKSVFLHNTELLLSLSRDFIDNMPDGVNMEALAVYGIINTLMVNIDEISAVRLMIEGETLPVARTDIDISQPLIGNVAIIKAQ